MCTLVLLYVDDMIISGDNEYEISHLRNDLSIRFEMKNLGEVGYFLGLEVSSLHSTATLAPAQQNPIHKKYYK